MALYKHQLEIIEFIQTHDRALCVCPCGSGKTRAALEAVESAFIIAPLRVALMVWPEEAGILGKACTYIKGAGVRDKKAAYYATNFENAPHLHEIRLPKGMDTLIIDESSKLKGFQLRQGGKRAKMIYEFSQKFKKVILLTGTPAASGLGDIYSQVTFLDGGRTFGRSKFAFMQRYHTNVSYDNKFAIWRENAGARESVLEACGGVCRYFNPDIQTQGEYITEIVYSADSNQYNTLSVLKKKHVCKTSNGVIYSANNAILASKVLHIASGFSYLEGGAVEWHSRARVDILNELIEEIGERCVIVAYWRASLAAIESARSDITRDIEAFKRGEFTHLLITPAAAGHGLSLQMQSNHMVVYEPFFSCEQYEQVMERIGARRQAQSNLNRPAYYHLIVSDLGVDKAAFDSVRKKADAEAAVLAQLLQL